MNEGPPVILKLMKKTMKVSVSIPKMMVDGLDKLILKQFPHNPKNKRSEMLQILIKDRLMLERSKKA